MALLRPTASIIVIAGFDLPRVAAVYTVGGAVVADTMALVDDPRRFTENTTNGPGKRFGGWLMKETTKSLDPLRDFIAAVTRLVDRTEDERILLGEGRDLLAALIATDQWLPDDCARPHPEHYQQYLLHCDPLERFSIVSFVWGPGQKTPIHNHTVWGMIGMLRGSETGQHYTHDARGSLVPAGGETVLQPGDVDVVSPRLGDIHKVENAFDDQVSISIHVYGANIGAVNRNVWDRATGASKSFVSGYSSATMPNLWDRSASVRR